MTTRFLYLTDTHWGALPGVGYFVQPRDPAKSDALYTGLRHWLSQPANKVDFIVHGGDVVDHGGEAEIIRAAGMLHRLGAPVHLCLGNHDLDQPTSVDCWRARHDGLLGDPSGSFAVTFKDFHLYLLAPHWENTQPSMHWDAPRKHLMMLEDQQKRAFLSFATQADRPVILALHTPAHGAPPEQTGQTDEAHPPDPGWRDAITDLLDQAPAVRLVLSGHTHVNAVVRHRDCVMCSTASFAETPFEARLVTVSRGTIEVQTLCFGDLLSISGEWDPKLAWVQGGEAQRRFRIATRKPKASLA